MRYGLSALWRHHYGRLLAITTALMCLVLSYWRPGWAVAIGLMYLGVVGWESIAKWHAHRHGFSVLYVLPSPSRWVARRLRALGYTGPVAPHLWEMHVNESRSWIAHDEGDAVQRFRAAYTADRLRWLAERPCTVGLMITTFNRLPADERRALEAAGAWIVSGALTSQLPRVASRRRVDATQLRMFGAVVSDRDRTDFGSWTTVYVPPCSETF